MKRLLMLFLAIVFSSICLMATAQPEGYPVNTTVIAIPEAKQQNIPVDKTIPDGVVILFVTEQVRIAYREGNVANNNFNIVRQDSFNMVNEADNLETPENETQTGYTDFEAEVKKCALEGADYPVKKAVENLINAKYAEPKEK